MLARNGSIGTPTMPDAQVKIFIGIGVNPPSTSSQNAFHGDSAMTSRSDCDLRIDPVQPAQAVEQRPAPASKA